MWVNLSAKKQDPLVNYREFNPIQVNDENITISNTIKTVNFHIPTLVEEVKQIPRKELKEYRRNIKTFLATLSTSFLMSPLKSMAATSLPTTSNLPSQADGIPPELLKLMIQLVAIIVAVGIMASIICLVLSGIGRMFRMKDMTKWTSDIVKGLIQVMVAIPVVFMIYFLANLIFGGSGWWVSPFSMK